MKKLLLTLFIAILFFSSCEQLGLYDTKITNNSSYDITFTMSQYTIHASTHSVSAGETITISNPKGSTINEYTNFQRVEYNSKLSWEGVFSNRHELQLKINNTFSFPVTLSAGGFMGIDPVIDIPSGISYNTIFTESPNFIITANGFPATTEYNVVGNSMFVTIR